MVDSGASRTVVRRLEFDTLCKISGRRPILKPCVDLCGVTGTGIKVYGKTELKFDNVGVLEVIIVDDIGRGMILGRDAMRANRAKIDYDNGVLIWADKRLPLLPKRPEEVISSFGDKPPKINDNVIQKCVNDYEHLFAARGEALGCHPDIMIRLETTGGPIRRRPYRLPLAKRKALDEKIQEYLAQGIIAPSSSPWSSPVVLVGKKDQSEGPRFCIDYTGINKILKHDCFPIPLIRDIFDQLQGATIFSTLDLKSGYHQLPIHPDDQEKTAFVCHAGQFEFLRLPMGLKTATQKFQRAMEIVLKGLIGKICMIYVDDVVCYSQNEIQHAEHLKMIFDRLDQYNLRLNPSKCVFGFKEVKLLGYIVSEKGLAADPDKVAAIARMKAPANLAQTRSFLGMCGYYRTLIRDFAKIAEPLVKLQRKDVKFEWTEQQQTAFETLKTELCSENVMAHPRPDKQFYFIVMLAIMQ